MEKAGSIDMMEAKVCMTSFAVGLSFGSCCMQLLKSASTAGGHSSGTLHTMVNLMARNQSVNGTQCHCADAKHMTSRSRQAVRFACLTPPANLDSCIAYPK